MKLGRADRRGGKLRRVVVVGQQIKAIGPLDAVSGEENDRGCAPSADLLRKGVERGEDGLARRIRAAQHAHLRIRVGCGGLVAQHLGEPLGIRGGGRSRERAPGIRPDAD